MNVDALLSRPLLEQGLRIADEMDAVPPLLQSADQGEELSLTPAPDAFGIDEQEGDHYSRNWIAVTMDSQRAHAK